MLAKRQIQRKLEEIYEPADVRAGQVYKGWDFDGYGQYYGWWYCPFNQTPIFLGKSKDDAFCWVEATKDDRAYAN